MIDRNQQITASANQLELLFSFDAARLYRTIAERSDSNGYVSLSKKGFEYLCNEFGFDIESIAGSMFFAELQPIYSPNQKLCAVIVTSLQPEPTT